MLFEILISVFGIDVVGIVGDLFEVCNMIKRLDLDVIILDIEMLKMDGIIFLCNLMCLRFMFVVMILILM